MLITFGFLDQQNNDTLTQDNSHFVSLNVLVSTYQEGYLFHASTTNFEVINSTFINGQFIEY